MMPSIRSFFLYSSMALTLSLGCIPHLLASSSSSSSSSVDSSFDDFEQKQAAAKAQYKENVQRFDDDLLVFLMDRTKTTADVVPFFKNHPLLSDGFLNELSTFSSDVMRRRRWHKDQHHVSSAKEASLLEYILDRFYPDLDVLDSCKNLLSEIKDFLITPTSGFVRDYTLVDYFGTKKHAFHCSDGNACYDEELAKYLAEKIALKIKDTADQIDQPRSYAHDGFLKLLTDPFSRSSCQPMESLDLKPILIQRCAEWGVHPLFIAAHAGRLSGSGTLSRHEERAIEARYATEDCETVHKHWLLAHYLKSPSYEAYQRMVQDIIDRRDPNALHYYQLLLTGKTLFPIKNQKGKLVKELFFASQCPAISNSTIFPYMQSFEAYLTENHPGQIPYFRRAADQPITQVDALTDAQLERLVEPKTNPPGHGLYNWDTFIAYGSSYRIGAGQIEVNSTVIAGGDIVYRTGVFTLGAKGVLDAAGKVFVVAEKFNIHPDAKIHGTQSVEFIQLSPSHGDGPVSAK